MVATAALSPLFGVPVYGRNFGDDFNFALAALSHMDAAWQAGQPWPRWVMDGNLGLGATTFYTYPPLAYWAGAALRRLSGLGVADTLALAVALWRGAFVLGCFLWLRRHVPPPAALAAAALVALLPYPALVNPWGPLRLCRDRLLPPCCPSCCWRSNGRPNAGTRAASSRSRWPSPPSP